MGCRAGPWGSWGGSAALPPSPGLSCSLWTSNLLDRPRWGRAGRGRAAAEPQWGRASALRPSPRPASGRSQRRAAHPYPRLCAWRRRRSQRLGWEQAGAVSTLELCPRWSRVHAGAVSMPLLWPGPRVKLQREPPAWAAAPRLHRVCAMRHPSAGQGFPRDEEELPKPFHLSHVSPTAPASPTALPAPQPLSAPQPCQPHSAVSPTALSAPQPLSAPQCCLPHSLCQPHSEGQPWRGPTGPH